MSSPTGMAVMCSVRMGLSGSSLRESKLSGSALNGNQDFGKWSFVGANTQLYTPYFNPPLLYTSSLIQNTPAWWSSSCTFFNTNTTTGGTIAYSSSQDNTWPGTNPPIDTQKPTGNEPSSSHFLSTGSYFGLLPPKAVSNELNYSLFINYGLTRVNSISASQWSFLWANAEVLSFNYPKRGMFSATSSLNQMTSPIDSFLNASGAETITYTGAGSPIYITTYLLIAQVSLDSVHWNSGVITPAGLWTRHEGRYVIGHTQMKNNSITSQSYYTIEVPPVFGSSTTFTGSLGNNNVPYLISSSGSVAPNGIIDIPPSIYWTGSFVGTYPGVGDFAILGLNTFFLPGLPAAHPNLNSYVGMNGRQLVRVTHW